MTVVAIVSALSWSSASNICPAQSPSFTGVTAAIVPTKTLVTLWTAPHAETPTQILSLCMSNTVTAAAVGSVVAITSLPTAVATSDNHNDYNGFYIGKLL